jgi:hypothetical protein
MKTNLDKTIIFLFLLLFNNIFCKKIVNKIPLFKFVPINNILYNHPEILYKICDQAVPFKFKLFPLSVDHTRQPYQGYFLPTFIVKIPNGTVQGMQGLVLIDNQCIDEMIWRDCPSFYMSARKIKSENVIKIAGRVAVITQPAYENYFHWTIEVLARLAFLEKEGIEYDHLYAPQKSKFMRETLKMWGVSEEKIIAPASEDFAIQADEIILPSLVCNSNHGWTQFANYIRPDLVTYVKDKLFIEAQKEKIEILSKRVFISRKDAPFRKVLNEDELFAQFEQYGFVRYELSKLSVSEQIMLFNQAEIIVSPQGTGLANSIFCGTSTKIIELFQGLGDCTFWYISQIFNLNYTPIQTIPFERNFFKAWQSDTYIPLSVIKDVQQYIK